MPENDRPSKPFVLWYEYHGEGHAWGFEEFDSAEEMGARILRPETWWYGMVPTRLMAIAVSDSQQANGGE